MRTSIEDAIEVAALLFQLLVFHLSGKLCKRASIIIVSNLRFGDRASLFGDAEMTTAPFGSFTHRCHIPRTTNPLRKPLSPKDPTTKVKGAGVSPD